MKLKEFLEKVVKDSPISSLQLVQKLIELESIENFINIMYGVELDIKVKPAEKKEGHYYGKNIIEKLKC